MILSVDGPYGNIIKTKPPMCFSREDVDQFMDKFVKILQEVTNTNSNAVLLHDINNCLLNGVVSDTINSTVTRDDGDINMNIQNLELMQVH